MRVRLQVLLAEEEMDAIREDARLHGMTVSEWVRRVLNNAHSVGSTGDRASKLAAVRAASRHDFPVADIDQMLDDIERGYKSS